MADALALLGARRAGLEVEPFAGLTGRFHSHLTIRWFDSDPSPIVGPADARTRLERVARAFHAKVTVIDLVNLADRAERDVMVTRYHVDDAPGALGRIADTMSGLCTELHRSGFVVQRVKVEHESEPSLPGYDAEHYHEVHVKLSIPTGEFDAAYAWLRREGAHYGWVPSRNPYERRLNDVVQFVTMRCYDGDRATADARVREVVAALEAGGLAIVEVKRETAVLDTNTAHDRWWAAPLPP